jgi:SAM-dependent methyltransferase
MTNSEIQPHNVKPQATWNAGGAGYDEISREIASSIEHCVFRVTPRANESVLDVATGTGWAARRAKQDGARVTGIDLGPDLILSAKQRAEKEHLQIDYLVGDAEKLPFEDASFDVVISTFGVMFCTSPESAARELARVCKKGGRLGLTTWPSDGVVAKMFAVLKPYMAPPPSPAPPSPFAWGSRERVRELLGSTFDLTFEDSVTIGREPSAEAMTEIFFTGYGPTRTLAANLDADRRQKLRREFTEFHAQYRSDLGVQVPRDYLLTIGVRK